MTHPTNLIAERPDAPFPTHDGLSEIKLRISVAGDLNGPLWAWSEAKPGNGAFAASRRIDSIISSGLDDAFRCGGERAEQRVTEAKASAVVALREMADARRRWRYTAIVGWAAWQFTVIAWILGS